MHQDERFSDRAPDRQQAMIAKYQTALLTAEARDEALAFFEIERESFEVVIGHPVIERWFQTEAQQEGLVFRALSLAG